MNKTLTQSSQSYNLFIKDMHKMEQELEGKKNKERFGKLKESSETFTQQHEQAIVMLQRTTKSLFGIVEDIAEKEIERDPLEFIRKESFVQNSF